MSAPAPSCQDIAASKANGDMCSMFCSCLFVIAFGMMASGA